MRYEAYIANQTRVYDEFRVATAALNELYADPCVSAPSAAYLIALRHCDAITQPFAKFTASLRQIAPSLVYDATNAHTTITVYDKQPLATFEQNPHALNMLREVVSRIDQKLWKEIRIDFRHWHFNEEAIIVAGAPNDAFWELGEQVKAQGEKLGVPLRMPWGAHMTAGRFTRSSNAEVVQRLRERIQDAPLLGVSAPVAIHVGYDSTSEAGFCLNSVHAFS